MVEEFDRRSSLPSMRGYERGEWGWRWETGKATMGDDADRLGKALQGGQYSILRREVTSSRIMYNTEGPRLAYLERVIYKSSTAHEPCMLIVVLLLNMALIEESIPNRLLVCILDTFFLLSQIYSHI
jgi:hypothetical protein